MFKIVKNWLINCNNYGFRKTSIYLLLTLSLMSTFFEIGGLSIFLPIFQFMSNKSGEILIDTGLTNKIINSFNLIGIDPTLEILLIAAFLFLCLRQAMNYFSVLYTSKIHFNLIKVMRDMLFKNYLSAKSKYQEERPVGILSNTIIRETSGAVNALMLPVQIISNIIAIIGAFIFLMMLSWTLTLSTIPIFIIVSRLPYRFVKKTKVFAKLSVATNNEMSAFLISRLKSPKIIKISCTEKKEYALFSDFTKKQFDLVYMIKKLKAITTTMIEPVFISMALIIIYISYMYLNMTIAEIGLFMFTINKLGPMQKALIVKWQTMNEHNASGELVTNNILELNDQKEFDKGKNELVEIKEKISMKNLYFSYNSNKQALENINIEFKIKSINILIGPSGAGKSTLVDIIPRLILPEKGNVFIDDNDYLMFDIISLRKMISFVPQNPQILSGTIRDHISYGIENVTENKIIKAAKLASAHQFITQLENGYDTFIGEDAYNLSGGQRQRLELSRSLLRKSKILIMDEPTANLDYKNINIFNKTISTIKEQKDIIIILITHQLIKNIKADQIIVLNDGKVESVGSIDTLKIKSDWYKNLYSS